MDQLLLTLLQKEGSQKNHKHLAFLGGQPRGKRELHPECAFYTNIQLLGIFDRKTEEISERILFVFYLLK